MPETKPPAPPTTHLPVEPCESSSGQLEFSVHSRKQLEPPEWLNNAWTSQLDFICNHYINVKVKEQVNKRLQAVEATSENKSSTEAITLYAKILNEFLDSHTKPWNPSKGFTIQMTIREILCSCYRRYPQIEVAIEAAKKDAEEQDQEGLWLSEEEFESVLSDEELEDPLNDEELEDVLRDEELENLLYNEELEAVSSNEESEYVLNNEDFQSIGISFLEILRLIEPPDSLELSLAFHTLATSLVKFTDAFAAAEAMYLRAIKQIQRNSGAHAPEAETAQQGLARLYIEKLFDCNQEQTFNPIQSWANQEQLIKTVFDGMERSLGENHQDVFKFLHSLGNRYLDAGMEGDAEKVFNEEWARKKKALGPYHISTLRAVKSLRNLYLGQERYLEVDSLLRASLDPITVTSTSRISDAQTFWRWHIMDRGLQGQLATLKAPGESLYWEDSRIYLKEIKDVNLVLASPPDPFPLVPLRIIVSGDQLDVEISRIYVKSTGTIMGFEAEDQIVSYLQKTDIWRTLSSMASMLAWSQFQVDSFRIVFERVQPGDKSDSDPDKPDPDPEKPIPKTFWVFPEDQTVFPEDQTDVLKENTLEDQASCMHWGKHFQEHKCKLSTSRYQPRDLYVFERVGLSNTEWIVIGLQPRIRDSIAGNVDFDAANIDLITEIDSDAGDIIFSADDLSLTNAVPHGFVSNQERFYAQDKLKPKNMEYLINDNEDNSISITLPYVSYADFKRTRGYHYDLLYEDYFQALECLIHRPRYSSGNTFLKYKHMMCVKANGQQAREQMPKFEIASTQEPRLTATRGFFNGTPGDSAIITNIQALKSFNFVSSEWAEWKRFTLHTVPEDSTPELKDTGSQPIVCHGYISGTWTSQDLSTCWLGFRVFVVDVVFLVRGSEEKHLFWFTADSFVKENCHQLSSCEKRFFCGSLNPTLFRSEYPRMIIWGSVFERIGKGKEEAKERKNDLTFWEEMNRREMWDRAFEKKLRLALARARDGEEMRAKEELDFERQEEDTSRLEWDTRQARQIVT